MSDLQPRGIKQTAYPDVNLSFNDFALYIKKELTVKEVPAHRKANRFYLNQFKKVA